MEMRTANLDFLSGRDEGLHWTVLSFPCAVNLINSTVPTNLQVNKLITVLGEVSIAEGKVSTDEVMDQFKRNLKFRVQFRNFRYSASKIRLGHLNHAKCRP